jgi:hypothetical protein
MQTPNFKVTLTADRYAIAAKEMVQLKAVVTPPLTESADCSIEFKADKGGAINHQSGEFTATWTATGKGDALITAAYPICVTVKDKAGKFDISAEVEISVFKEPSLRVSAIPASTQEGGLIKLNAGSSENETMLQNLKMHVEWSGGGTGTITLVKPTGIEAHWDTTGVIPGSHDIRAVLQHETGDVLTSGGSTVDDTMAVQVDARPLSRVPTIPVALQRSTTPSTRDQSLWTAIRNRTKAISFSGSGYKDFIDRVLCKGDPLPVGSPRGAQLTRELQELGGEVNGVGAYELLKTATQAFLLLECGVAINVTGTFDNTPIFDPADEAVRYGETVTLEDLKKRLSQYLGPNGLPYMERVMRAAFPDERIINRVHCYGVLGTRVRSPCMLELIWSYWHEEGMLVQSLNAISRRFQNVRGPGDRDPLAHLEIDPLRPLNNLMWGFIQDEQNRLTLKRRAYEYDHHYGVTIYGKAVPTLRSADSRSKFLEAFHNLLHLCSIFYKEDNDTTVIADGFPLLNALKEVHLLLAQGAHNQFGDLPWTARAEMLIQQWLMARPEMRDFLQSRAMVPYKEAWMPQVDTMKTLQGWSDVTITHFRDLGVYGEQILLSIRYGDWIQINLEDSAKNWARSWRPEIQGYLHAYRAVTGVDLSNPDTVDYTMPAVHLQRRLAGQRVR